MGRLAASGSDQGPTFSANDVTQILPSGLAVSDPVRHNVAAGVQKTAPLPYVVLLKHQSIALASRGYTE